MRVIFDKDVEFSDFIEIILTQDELDKLLDNGVTKDFKTDFEGNKDLNISIYVGDDED